MSCQIPKSCKLEIVSESCSSSRKRKQPPFELCDRPAKRPKCHATILDLPSEILQQIFSYLPPAVVYYQLSPVCERWRNIITDPELWRKMRKIVLDDYVSTKPLLEFPKKVPVLKHLVVKNRNDVNSILEIVMHNCKNLETLEFFNCRGSCTEKFKYIRSDFMCQMIAECQNLRIIRFENTGSWRFLKRLLQSIRKIKIETHCSGPIDSVKLYITLFERNKMDVPESCKIVDFRIRDLCRLLNAPRTNSPRVLHVDLCLTKQ